MRQLTFLLFCGAAFGQIELVNNQWPTGSTFFPDAKLTYVSRLTYQNSNTPVVGLPYWYTIKQYAGQGYHTHETANGCCTVTRPVAVFVPDSVLPQGGENGVTDAQGYANANIEFNNFSGWYTVCVNTQYGQRCINNNTRYFTNNLGYPVYLERYTGGLPPYDSSSINQPQAQHRDGRHSLYSSSSGTGTGEAGIAEGYVTRWVTHDIHLRLLGLSNYYKTQTAQSNVADLVDITRASLPDGGIYDNDVAGVAPGSGNTTLDWDTRVFEEHQRGNEADITIPQGATRQSILFSSAYASGCYPGKYKPTSELIYTGSGADEATQIQTYWTAQGVVHVSCKPGQSLRGGNRPPPFAK